MPLRWLTAAGCALCFAAGGFLSARRLKKRCAGLAAAGEAVALLQGEVGGLDRPLGEAVAALAEQSPYWREVELQGSPLDEESWLKAAYRLGLLREDASPLLRLRRELPSRPRGDCSAFTLCRDSLRILEEKARAQAEKEGPLRMKLGALLGAAAFLLLC